MKVFTTDRKSEAKDKRDHYYNNPLVHWLRQNSNPKICISTNLGRNNWWMGVIFLCLSGLSSLIFFCFNFNMGKILI